MKLNKKGFTLIELLAVVVIMLAISMMAITSISAAIERNKEKQNNAKKRVLESYAELYYQEHKNSLSVSGCITIDTLYTKGVASDSEIEDANGDKFTGGIKYTNGTNFQYKTSC